MFEEAVKYLNVVAGADLSSPALDNTGVMHKIVNINGTIASGPTTAVGALKSKGKVGEGVRVAVEGVIKCWAGAAVSTLGYPVTVTTSGFVVAATSGGYTIGKAFTLANSGDLFAVFADFATLGAFVS
jgi:hypothetical protein